MNVMAMAMLTIACVSDSQADRQAALSRGQSELLTPIEDDDNNERLINRD